MEELKVGDLIRHDEAVWGDDAELGIIVRASNYFTTVRFSRRKFTPGFEVKYEKSYLVSLIKNGSYILQRAI